MSYLCYLCNCCDCRVAYRCEQCKSCNGSGEKAIGSCAQKVPMEIAPAIAIAALQLVFNVRDPRTLAKVFLGAERGMDAQSGDVKGFDSAEILRERLCENAGSIPAISTKRGAR